MFKNKFTKKRITQTEDGIVVRDYYIVSLWSPNGKDLVNEFSIETNLVEDLVECLNLKN